MKGVTYVEILITLALIPFILGIIGGAVKLKNYLSTSRDLQRLQDAYALNSALNFYFRNAINFDPDGPNLDNRGVDETYPTIFVSVPDEQDQFFETCYCPSNDKAYYIYQTNKNDYQKINGSGWIPIDFSSLNYPGLSYLPVDPSNTLRSGLYYMYAFRRNPPQYEISLSFESPEYRLGGVNDKVSTDGGNDPNRLELGNNLELICPFIYSF